MHMQHFFTFYTRMAGNLEAETQGWTCFTQTTRHLSQYYVTYITTYTQFAGNLEAEI
jgi:hypothetical protein